MAAALDEGIYPLGLPCGDVLMSWAERGEDEENEDDVFFTEEAYNMYSLSHLTSLDNVRYGTGNGARTVTRPRRGRDNSEKMKEKQASKVLKKQQPLKEESATPKVAKQPKKKKISPTYSLASPYLNVNYPTFSRLTIGQHKKFMELQAKYGSKGTRVTTSQESAELQHWRQLGAMIYQDQQDFNGFAEFVAKQHPEVYMNIPPAAIQYITNALKSNLERVETLPRHYAVLQSFTLNPGVPLPSDPTMQTIGSPVFLGKVPEMSVPGLDEKKVTLKRSPIEGEPEPVKNDTVTRDHNLQKLAQMHKADIVLSSGSLLTLVNNHAPHYEEQWEIPVEVKAVNSDSIHQRVVCLGKPLMKQGYYLHEASALYHKFLLKRLLTSGLSSRDKYSKTTDRIDDNIVELADIEEECHLEQEERRGHLFPEEDFGDFGAASILDLETFGSEPPVLAPIKKAILDTKEKGRGQDVENNDSAITDKPMKVEPIKSGMGEPMEVSKSEADVIPELNESFNTESNDDGQDPSKDSETRNEGSHSVEIKEEGPKIEDADEVSHSIADPEDIAVIGECEKPVQIPEKRISKVVRMNVRRNSKSVSDEDQTLSADAAIEVCGQAEKIQAFACQKRQRTRMARMRFSSDSSSDDEVKLTIVTDSDIQSSGEKEVPKQGALKHQIAEDALDSDSHREAEGANMDVSVNANKKIKPENTNIDQSQDIGMNVKDKTNKSEMKDVPVPRMVTRRSARIRQQSSSEEKMSDDHHEGVPQKRPRGRRKKQEADHQTTDKEEGKEQERNERGSKDDKKDVNEVSQEDRKLTGEESNVALLAEEVYVDTNIGRRTRSCKREFSSDGSPTKVSTHFTKSTALAISGAGSAQNVNQNSGVKCVDREQAIVQDKQESMSIPNKCQTSPTEPKSRPVAKRQLRNTAASAKTRTPSRPVKIAGEPKTKAASTIDEIMRLQEKMLTRQKSNPGASTSAPPTEDLSVQGHTVESQTKAEHLQAQARLYHEGMELEDIKEGNYAYSLWKFGRLRMLVRSKSHGLLQEGLDGGQNVASVVTKMEPQANLGLTMQTQSDLTKVWLSMYLRPGSKVMRGRIDSRTSEIVSWECLDNSWIVQSQQLFNPGICMKMLYQILMKLGGLSEGRYLLRHRPGDAHVCIYQCMEQAAKNMRASYDLHAAHQAAKLMTSLPPTMPWIPLDPNAPYPSSRWQGCAPLTFPPCPPKFKHPSTQHQHQHQHPGGRNKKKKKKKK